MEKWHWGSWISKCRGMKLNPRSSCIGINSKWTRCLSVRGETLKLLEEKPGKVIQDIGIGQNSEKTLVIQKMKSCAEKMGLHEVKIKASAQPKKQSCGKTAVQWGEIFSSYTFDRWLISKIFKKLN